MAIACDPLFCCIEVAYRVPTVQYSYTVFIRTVLFPLTAGVYILFKFARSSIMTCSTRST